MESVLQAKIFGADWSWTQSRHTMFIALAVSHIADRRGCCTAPQAEIADMCGLSIKTISRSLLEMQAKGWLHISERFGPDGGRISNAMQFTMPAGYVRLVGGGRG